MNTEDSRVALQATRVSKRYRQGSLALNGVSLRIPRGTITALVGPNAAGKSTLIKTWVAFERPTAGLVAVHGVDPWQDRAAALTHLAYVPQQPTLYRGLSVADHLDIAAHIRRGFDQDAAKKHLTHLDVPLAARPTALSGGQQAQVMLAIALGTRAEVLLLDEPLAGLDPLARSEFLDLLATAVREQGCTVLLSSHIVTDIEQVCDRLIVLGVGQVLLDDTLVNAVASHRASFESDQSVISDRAVGVFRDESGRQVVLVKTSGDFDVALADSMRTPTLDEVVKGYLIAGRIPRREVAS